MKKNVGTIDRSIRGLVGVALLLVFALGVLEGTAGIIALIVGVVMLGTAAVGWCPPYTLLGINTGAPKDEAENT